MPPDTQTLAARTRHDLLRRNAVLETFFQREAPRLARACHEMSRRFLAGGRLWAFGSGAAAATDAQHVAVEFIHPIIVGKRALPASDLGVDFEARIAVLVEPNDMVIGFSPAPDPAAERALTTARAGGALTFGLVGAAAEYAFDRPDADPFVCQEVFEVLYHVLWETVHVYFEHREQGHDVGASAFLYPMLGKQAQPLDHVVTEVQVSMRQKAEQVNRLRTAAADTEADSLARMAGAICARLERGGKLIAFGNGGSATDANDLVADCLAPPSGWRPVPALSLATEPANITALANDIGIDAIFTRQLIAHARPADVAVAISTSGGSGNLLAALAQARAQGLLTVGILGYDGGRIVSDHLADHTIIVRSDYVPRIQEVQASLYHVLRARILDARL